MAKQLRKLGRWGKIKAILIASAIMFPSLSFLSFKDRSKDALSPDDSILTISKLSSFAYGAGCGGCGSSCSTPPEPPDPPPCVAHYFGGVCPPPPKTPPPPADTGDCKGSEPDNIGKLKSIKLSGSTKSRVKPMDVSGRKCYEVNKTSAAGYDLFLPLKTNTEFQSFNKAGSGVTVKDVTRR